MFRKEINEEFPMNKSESLVIFNHVNNIGITDFGLIKNINAT